MSTQVAFTPSTQQPFTFQPVLSGVQYTATVPYNWYAQRYYIQIMDAVGNLVLYAPLVSSGPAVQADLTWALNEATATFSTPHDIPVGRSAYIRVSQTGTAFDGQWTSVATSPVALSYALQPDPQEATPLSGQVAFEINLTPGLGWLLFHYDTQMFEYGSSST